MDFWWIKVFIIVVVSRINVIDMCIASTSDEAWSSCQTGLDYGDGAVMVTRRKTPVHPAYWMQYAPWTSILYSLQLSLIHKYRHWFCLKAGLALRTNEWQQISNPAADHNVQYLSQLSQVTE